MKLYDSAEICPACKGKPKKLRPVADGDLIYIIEKDAMIAGSIDDILRQHDIPFVKRALQGAGLTTIVGSAFESYKFFVPYTVYENACELLSNFIETEVE